MDRGLLFRSSRSLDRLSEALPNRGYGMCNLYPITNGQQAIRELANAMLDRTGKLQPLPGIFPDHHGRSYEILPTDENWRSPDGNHRAQNCLPEDSSRSR
jgi:hypothetical protein